MQRGEVLHLQYNPVSWPIDIRRLMAEPVLHRLLIPAVRHEIATDPNPSMKAAEHTMEWRRDCFAQSPFYGDWCVAFPRNQINFATVNERCRLRAYLLRCSHEEMNSLSLSPVMLEFAHASNLVWCGFGSAKRTRGRIRSGPRIDDRCSCLASPRYRRKTSGSWTINPAFQIAWLKLKPYAGAIASRAYRPQICNPF